jgi:hypothetical protein
LHLDHSNVTARRREGWTSHPDDKIEGYLVCQVPFLIALPIEGEAARSVAIDRVQIAERNDPPISPAAPLPSRFLVPRFPLSDGSPKCTQGVDFRRKSDASRAILRHRNAFFLYRQGIGLANGYRKL